MPNAGDDLHHSAGTRVPPAYAPMRRTRIWSGAIWSYRPAILKAAHHRCQTGPKKSEDREGSSSRRDREKAKYSRLHTTHCGPEGIYVNALGNAEGRGPGGIFLIDSNSFETLLQGSGLPGSEVVDA
ncbi:selenium-binding protein SBP56-related protein [Mesorhizobium sp. A556]